MQIRSVAHCSFLTAVLLCATRLLVLILKAKHALSHSLIILQDRALDYLSTCIDQVHTFGDILQLVIVELIYKVSQSSTTTHHQKSCYIV